MAKTTLAQQVAAQWVGLVIINEVQRMPALLELPRPLCDDRNREAVFLLPGSASLDWLLPRQGRRWGFEFKCTDAPATTKSMHIACADLALEHLWVIYPGDSRYPLHEKMTALPLKQIGSVEFNPTP